MQNLSTFAINPFYFIVQKRTVKTFSFNDFLAKLRLEFVGFLVFQKTDCQRFKETA